MDVVLVGLPGSGKTAVGRRLARRHDAELIDLDEAIEREAGAPVPRIFADEGEAGFRSRERAAIEALGPPDGDAVIRRVIASGGGAVVDPRNRWRLYRRRLPIWLDVRPEVLAQRLRRSHTVRPLVASSGDPTGAVRRLAAARVRFYSAAHRVDAVAEPDTVLRRIDEAAETRLASPGGAASTILLDASTPVGRILLGDGIAASGVDAALRDLGSRRAILVSEPGAWSSVGGALASTLAGQGWPVERVDLPQGEAAKRLEVVERAARELARLRVERGEPLVAVGGGALGDTAGFIAAVWLRGVPVVHVPTTLVAQIDSSIGGKTAVDLPEGKNLIGAFHQPAAVVADVSLLRTLPERQLRAALGEAVKMAALGDERLLELLETSGDAIARGDPGAFDDGSIAELVERCAWAKVEVVSRDERETAAAGRIALNLGHTYGHALEAADGYATLLHGEAVAYGLRGAIRLGSATGVTPPERADRLEAVLDALRLGVAPLPYAADRVLGALAVDKKHADGQVRWVLPTADRVAIRSDVPESLVRKVLDELLAGRETLAAGTVGATR
ncbi:MAG TPA: bifunctional shikimate kinase/3-dehydroquinate synthase [Candidatus Dormibacteraeota bacterium]|nr:bifunctional shikimate kinase/3-dehydroquinate synthase [Candidatus Dormibacteraeota bacterium]